MKQALDEQRLAVIRARLLRMHFESGVGHIGGNLSAVDALALLFNERMGEHDRFLLSKGHSAGALYVALWSAAKLSDEDLRTFHRDETLLAGHPPASGIADILFATGSLGHGLSLASGTALALKLQGLPGHTYCLMSDGEWQEGSTWEALIFAAHRRMSGLTVLVDHNGLQGFGRTHDVASMFPLSERLKGFDVDLHLVSGHDLDQMRGAIDAATDRLKVIVLETIKGKGVSFMENRMEWHYLPLKEPDYQQALVELGQA
ncbi:transketolase [Luteibacter sp. 22Crub2.1]|uniref:transketolase n=1 Tax=Luteibacter sp. 22Crub2.1 TaxID=1283288 RepID=UPI0009A5FD28|nr:transketolase [Luteibacter sp. 22Crub2.1]SKC01186.1 transketolase [Luteibacter sp. 22Crub2.1]